MTFSFIYLATDTKISGVSVGVGVKISTSKKVVVGVSVFLTPKQFFFAFWRKNANKVGFRIKKYLRHLKTLVSVSVSDFPTPKRVVSVSVSEIGKTDTKKCWCRVSNSTLTPKPVSGARILFAIQFIQSLSLSTGGSELEKRLMPSATASAY